jgi:hypothetical protein
LDVVYKEVGRGTASVVQVTGVNKLCNKGEDMLPWFPRRLEPEHVEVTEALLNY